jgi:hypothetical protein
MSQFDLGVFLDNDKFVLKGLYLIFGTASSLFSSAGCLGSCTLFELIKLFPLFDVFFKNGVKLFLRSNHRVVDFSIHGGKQIFDIDLKIWLES